MPCLVGFLALFMPRVMLFLVWVFSDLLETAYSRVTEPFNVVVPLLGAIFVPLTTLAYAWAFRQGGGNGDISGFGLLVIAIAFILDLGSAGTSESSRRKSRRKGDEPAAA